MSDEKALLAAIWEHPHEDTPRLVFADWLQENSQPERAEFIRVQCELAALRKWDDSPRHAELLRREEQLLAAHATTWTSSLQPAASFKKARFHRGFPVPKTQRLSPGKFLKLTPTDFAAAPLWNFSIDTNRKLLLQLLASPNLLRVGLLEFDGWLQTPEEVRQFVTCPYLRNLHSLEVRHSGFDAERMTVLTAGENSLPHLRGLWLSHNALNADAMRNLTDSSLAGRLEALILSMNPLGPDGVLALAESSRLARLQELSVAGCGRIGGGTDLNGDAIQALFNSPHFANLREVHIGHSGLEQPDVLKLCESRPRFRLSELTMSDSGIGDRGAEAMAAWPVLEHVRVLMLTSCGIGAAGGRALVRSDYLNRVEQLWIQGNPVLDDPSVMANLRRRFGKALQER